MTYNEIELELTRRLKEKQLKDIKTNDMLEELEKINLQVLSEKEQKEIIYSIKLLTIKMFNDNYINIFELEQKAIKNNKEMEKFEGENEEKAFQDFKESIIEKILNAPQEEINKFKNKLNLKSDEEILKQLYKYYLISKMNHVIIL